MKALECPAGRGPHKWKAVQRGIACDRCGLNTRQLGEIRAARVEAECARRQKKAYERRRGTYGLRGMIYVPLGMYAPPDGPGPKIEVVRG